MSKIMIVRRKHIGYLAVMAAAVLVTAVFLRYERHEPAAAGTAGVRTIQLVTGEFESAMPDGRKIEAYRWDPGTIVVNKGETVELQITGISGGTHPFVIEGLGVKGEVRKGQTSTFTITPKASGTYPLLCLTHMGDEGGAMTGYIVVP